MNEWCEDVATGADGVSDRVLRGGDWYVDSGRCRAAHRYTFPPSFLNSHVGLRLARVPSVPGK